MSNVKGRRRATRRREQLPQRQGTGIEPGGTRGAGCGESVTFMARRGTERSVPSVLGPTLYHSHPQPVQATAPTNARLSGTRGWNQDHRAMWPKVPISDRELMTV